MRPDREVSWWSRAEALVADELHVERTVKDDDEEAAILTGRGVEHRLASWKVAICAGTDDLVVDREPTLENDDRVGGSMSMQLGLETGGVPDEIVLHSRDWIVVQKPDADLTVIRGEPRRAHLQRTQVIEDDQLASFHLFMTLPLPVWTGRPGPSSRPTSREAHALADGPSGA
jgi:hypothetical protein